MILGGRQVVATLHVEHAEVGEAEGAAAWIAVAIPLLETLAIERQRPIALAEVLRDQRQIVVADRQPMRVVPALFDLEAALVLLDGLLVLALAPAEVSQQLVDMHGDRLRRVEGQRLLCSRHAGFVLAGHLVDSPVIDQQLGAQFDGVLHLLELHGNLVIEGDRFIVAALPHGGVAQSAQQTGSLRGILRQLHRLLVQLTRILVLADVLVQITQLGQQLMTPALIRVIQQRQDPLVEVDRLLVGVQVGARRCSLHPEQNRFLRIATGDVVMRELGHHQLEAALIAQFERSGNHLVQVAAAMFRHLLVHHTTDRCLFEAITVALLDPLAIEQLHPLELAHADERLEICQLQLPHQSQRRGAPDDGHHFQHISGSGLHPLQAPMNQLIAGSR